MFSIIIKILILIDIILGILALFFKSPLLIFSSILFLIFLFKIYFKYAGTNAKRMNKISVFNKRALIFSDIVIFLIILVVIRLFQVQILNKDNYTSRVENQVTRNEIETGERGSILDSNSKQLAFNRREYTVVIDPLYLHQNNDRMIEILREFEKQNLIKANEDFYKKIEEEHLKGRRYTVVSRHIDHLSKKKMEKIIADMKLGSGKIIFEKYIEREYYRSDEYNNIVGLFGFTETSNDKKVGISGIERYYENYIKGKQIRRSKFYSGGKKMQLPTSKDNINTDLDGKNIHLTIDNEINYILNEELKDQFKKTNSEEAYGVIMEPNTGKIIAMATYTKNKKQSLRNQIFQDVYEPGSVIKPIVVAAALNENLISENTNFDIGDGTIKKRNHTIRENSRSTVGILNTKEVISKSSNVGMVLISDKIEDKVFDSYFEEFGFYDLTGVDFPGETKARRVPYQKWDKLKKNTMSFGQGIAITPIQMATAFSAAINGGTLYRPYIVEKITDSEGIVVRRNIPHKVREVIRPETSEKIKSMLEYTVDKGTARIARIEGYKLGGKTGTAQIPTKGGYLKQQYLASFIGFFPVENPEYVVLIMFNKPQGESVYSTYGGAVSGPVFKRIAERIIKSKSLLFGEVSTLTKNTKLGDKGQGMEELNLFMPDLKNRSAKDILHIFKDSEIDIKIDGVGLVVKQYPEAGTSLKDVKVIKLLLK